ncbi:MotA/TolQ/ExbB proton channel family protein [Candidatus Rhabdochlamydia porcellionis]|jgi:biopolymer transport protein ExbB|uniref:MotA/TolQ/ExbB proton channel family n=1 Tax=Candidatus Rhabdochlamydia porcellionis TaxID=225148 RepID=A0ABX8Z3X7_9BACT|nr:MotA/TolQ/ExbB proton channel family protein [Candidatus Rhabdochlamydia porcellionis]QZA58777.1 MotA/TolQ/ExbB proton channel family [Candidatus Rhabdochlamydia porcellionis]
MKLKSILVVGLMQLNVLYANPAELDTSDLVTIEQEFSLLDQELNSVKEQLIALEEDAHLDTSSRETSDETSFTQLQESISDFPSKMMVIDFKQAFSGAPLIYMLLFGMSTFALCLWFYCLSSLRNSTKVSQSLVDTLRSQVTRHNFDEALGICKQEKTLFCHLVTTGIHSRRYGFPVMVEIMKAEGKRVTATFWQRINLLNDIAIIAPMLGLLGTVFGMFYAFYDVNRSIESVSMLFDGLGISVGTTVVGLIVAILALILHSSAKYRLVKTLVLVESETHQIASLIDAQNKSTNI